MTIALALQLSDFYLDLYSSLHFWCGFLRAARNVRNAKRDVWK